MRVTKRDGTTEAVQFDKITERLQKLCWGIAPDVTRVAAKVCSQIVDGIATTTLDELTADVAYSLGTEHPEYATLASRILVSNLHKNTSDDVLETYAKMRDVLSPEFCEVVAAHRDALRAMVDYDRDYDFDYFGVRTMLKMYLTHVDGVVVERPQHMFLRVALGIWGDDMDRVRETYEALSTKKFTHASPTLFNAGLRHPQLSSCFLATIEPDSIDGIFDTATKCARISKFGGGIGLSASAIRAKGSVIKGTNGRSDGLVPMLRVFNTVAQYVNQGGRRKGSIAVYLEPHHADFLDFLDLRRNTGDDNLRARDLFLAAWIPDLFMKRVEADGIWSLMDPAACPGLNECHGAEYDALYERYEAEGRFVRQVPAQDVWRAIVRSQIETGLPYILFKDAANGKSNQQHLGTIKSSNLCVAGDTRILTKNGYHPIATLEGQRVEVWNGEEFSETTVVKTGENQKLLTVTLSNGSKIRCTPYHKFFVETSSRPSETSRTVLVEAKDLVPGDKIPRTTFPTIIGGDDTTLPTELAYTHGAFCGDGFYSNNGSTLSLRVHRPDKTTVFEKNLKYTRVSKWTNPLLKPPNDVATCFTLPRELPRKFYVPMNAPIETRLRWLEGYLDADACIIQNDGIKNIQFCSAEYEFINDIRLMLQTLGVDAKIALMREEGTNMLPDGRGGLAEYHTAALHRLNIDSHGIAHLASLGFAPHRLDISGGRTRHHRTNRYVRVVAVRDDGDVEDTWCFNEPKRHAGIFEGTIASQCTEIIEYSSPDEIAVCNLGSLSLPAFVVDRRFDFDALRAATRILARNLDRVIDKTYYPVEEARRSNMRHRPVGIGVQGLADVFQIMGMPFDSPEAAALNRHIFEHVYYAALETSVQLARELGAYETFPGSPASRGMLQPDLWNVKPHTLLDWDKLRADIREHGLRNSLSLAPMPTASTAQLLGNTEAFEPPTSNLYSRRTLAGEFAVVNKHLVAELLRRGVWTPALKNKIVAAEGSVQHVPEIPDDIKAVYKTAWELSMKTLIDMAADRGAYVCQSQSLNLFVAEPTFRKLSSMHFYAWKRGLKTGCYYLRTKPAARAVQVTVEPDCVACSS